MGLDMYLRRKKYIGANYRNVKGTIDITIDGKKVPIDLKRVSRIEEAVAYWRKANQIHNYIVEHFANGEDNCQPIYLELNDLEQLLDVCKKVRKSINLIDGQVEQSYTFNEKGEKVSNYVEGKVIEDTSICEELLPTRSGFFFGNTDYNEWYVEQIDYTIKTLEEIIQEEKNLEKQGFYSEFEYQASW